MRSGTFQTQFVRKKAVNQYPVRFEVAVAAPHKIDLVSRRAIKPLLWKQIEAELIDV